MARKKKNQDPDEIVQRLRGNIKLKYAAAYFQYESSFNKLEATQAKIQDLSNRPEYREVFRLLNQKDQLIRQSKELLEAVKQVGEQIRKKFSIPEEEWGNYVVDTETGKLTYLPPEEK